MTSHGMAPRGLTCRDVPFTEPCRAVAAPRGQERHLARPDQGLYPRLVELSDQPPVPPEGPDRPGPGGLLASAQVRTMR